jgi:hypothetical protein
MHMREGLVVVLAMLLLQVCALADRPEPDDLAPGTQPISSALPADAVIVSNPVAYSRRGEPIYSQQAIYQCDVDSDGKAESLVFYSRRIEDNAEMHLGIIRGPTDRGAWELAAECRMKGAYFWTRDPVVVVEGSQGKGVTLYTTTAFGASVGGTLVRVEIASSNETITCRSTLIQGSVVDVEYKSEAIEYTVKGETRVRKLSTASSRPSTTSADAN